MQIDVKTVKIEPKRVTFDHLERRFGNKAPSRYQEGTYDLQACENLHYKPTWAPDQTLYDPTLSVIRMRDWYDLKDPRQLYYSPYVLTRARQQDTMEANFSFVEKRGLAEQIPSEVRQTVLALLTPLRHVAWGANQNNSFICGYGYGAALTQPCIYHAMDHLAAAQYLSRLGLLIDGPNALSEGKRAWTQDAAWQPLRRYVEDCMALRDPIELFVAQNVVLDGLLYPLVFETLVDNVIASRGGATVGLLTLFMTEWQSSTRKWVDAVIKVMGLESEENHATLRRWIETWTDQAVAALLPVVDLVPNIEASTLMQSTLDGFHARMSKAGIASS